SLVPQLLVEPAWPEPRIRTWGSRNALDNLRDSVGSVAARHGDAVYAGRVHLDSAGGGDRDCAHTAHQRAASRLTAPPDRARTRFAPTCRQGVYAPDRGRWRSETGCSARPDRRGSWGRR